METFKQIIYREDDTALMIIPTNEQIQTIARFVNELSIERQLKFEKLKLFCLTKIDTLQYVVNYTGSDVLNLQSDEDQTIQLIISNLSDYEKLLINEVNNICMELINNI